MTRFPWLFIAGIVVFFSALAAALFANQASQSTTRPGPPPSTYSCPTSDYVNCMPGPDAPIRPQCNPAYLTWAHAHCPGFKGAAM